MNLQSKWKQKYDILKKYISSNPEIQINKNEISIPRNLRREFYRLFDDIRETIADQYYADLPGEVDLLCRNYSAAEKETLERLNLDRVEQPVDLAGFLQSPKEGVMRSLYNRLFDMAQGKIGEDVFEGMADNDIRASLWDLYRLGYESWAALSLINSLEPDQAFRVEFNEEHELCVSELKEIVFGRQPYHPSKRVPEFILHSRKPDKYIAFKFALAREVDTFYFPAGTQDRPRDRTGDTSNILDSRVIFISIVQDLKSIPVFVDIHSHKIISNPDLTVEFLTGGEGADSNELYNAQKRAAIMKPKLGGYAVLMNSPQQYCDGETDADMINIIHAGFDQSKLRAITERLKTG